MGQVLTPIHPGADISKGKHSVDCLFWLLASIVLGMRFILVPGNQVRGDDRSVLSIWGAWKLWGIRRGRSGYCPNFWNNSGRCYGCCLGHTVLLGNVTFDRAIIWIEGDAQRNLDWMLGKDEIIETPIKQRMKMHRTLEREYSEKYKAALQMAVLLTVSPGLLTFSIWNFHWSWVMGEPPLT